MSDLTDQMRAAAATLELVARVYNLSPQPAAVEMSAKWLRHEANILDRPLP